MIAITFAPFISALGYAILNSLWQMAFLWFLNTVLLKLFKLKANQKYTIHIFTLFLGFAWFIINIIYYTQLLTNYSTTHQGNHFQIISTENTTLNSYLLNIMLKVEASLPYLSIAYLLMLSLLSIKWAVHFRQTLSHTQRKLEKIDVEWRLFTDKIAKRFQIKRKINIYISHKISSPLTIGFWKPLILIPIASINQLTTQQLEAIILHELAHIKRNDFIINVIISCIETILFFNPFAYWLGKKIRIEREHACDDWVLQFQYNPIIYAEALLNIAKNLHSVPAFALHAVDNNELLGRIRRMIAQQEAKHQQPKFIWGFALMAIMLSSLGWMNHPQPKNNTTVISKTATVVLEPIAAQVSNPLFNPIFFLNDGIQDEVDKAVAQIKQPKEEQILRNIQEVITLSTQAFHNNLVPQSESKVNIALELSKIPQISKDSLNNRGLVMPYFLEQTLQHINFNQLEADLKLAEKEMKMAAQKMKTEMNNARLAINSSEIAKQKAVTDSIKKEMDELKKFTFENVLTYHPNNSNAIQIHPITQKQFGLNTQSFTILKDDTEIEVEVIEIAPSTQSLEFILSNRSKLKTKKLEKAKF